MIIVDYKNNRGEVLRIILEEYHWERWKKFATRPDFIQTIIKATEMIDNIEIELYSVYKNNNLETVENNTIISAYTTLPPVSNFQTFPRQISIESTFNGPQFSAPILSTPTPGQNLVNQGIRPNVFPTFSSRINPQPLVPITTTVVPQNRTNFSSSELPLDFQVFTHNRGQSTSSVISTMQSSNTIPPGLIKDDDILVVVYYKCQPNTKIRTSKLIKGSILNSWIEKGASDDKDILNLSDIIGISDTNTVLDSKYVKLICEKQNPTLVRFPEVSKKPRKITSPLQPRRTTKPPILTLTEYLKIYHLRNGELRCQERVKIDNWEKWHEGKKQFKNGGYVKIDQVTKVTQMIGSVETEIYPINDRNTIKITYIHPRLQKEETMNVSGKQLREWIVNGLSTSAPISNFENIVNLHDTIANRKINIALIKERVKQAEINRSSTSEQSALTDVTTSLAEQRVSPTASPSLSNQSEIQPNAFNPDYSPDFQAQSYSPPSSPTTRAEGIPVLSTDPAKLINLKQITERQSVENIQEQTPVFLFPNLSIPSTPVDLNFQWRMDKSPFMLVNSFTKKENSHPASLLTISKSVSHKMKQKKNEESIKYIVSFQDNVGKEHKVEISKEDWGICRRNWNGWRVTNKILTTDFNISEAGIFRITDAGIQEISSITEVIDGKETLIYPNYPIFTIVEKNNMLVNYYGQDFRINTMMIDGRTLNKWIESGTLGVISRIENITQIHDEVLNKDIDLNFIKQQFRKAGVKREQRLIAKEQSEINLNQAAFTLSAPMINLADMKEWWSESNQGQPPMNNKEEQSSVILFPHLSVPSSPDNLSVQLFQEQTGESNLPEESGFSLVNFSVFSQSYSQLSKKRKDREELETQGKANQQGEKEKRVKKD